MVTNCRYIYEESQIEYYGERSFAYELYRQWQDLIENGVEDLVINAEISKKYEEDKFLVKLARIFGLTDGGEPHKIFIPDLVCHHSQYDSERQEVICEIKTKDGIKDKNKLYQDIKKLAAYMSDKVLLCHPFKVGAFILIGGDFSDIIVKSDKLINKKKNNIYCILYNVKSIDAEKMTFIPDVQCRTLAEIYDNVKK